jgi:hypothetical protein
VLTVAGETEAACPGLGGRALFARALETCNPSDLGRVTALALRWCSCKIGAWGGPGATVLWEGTALDTALHSVIAVCHRGF